MYTTSCQFKLQHHNRLHLCLWFTYAVTLCLLWLMPNVRCWKVSLDMPDAILWCLSRFKMICGPPPGWISLPQSLPALDLSLFIHTQTDRAASQLVTFLYLSWFRYKHTNPQTCPTDLHVTEGRCCIMSVNYDCPCSLEQPCTRLMGFPNACISMQELYSCNSVNLRGCFLFDHSPVLVSRGNILSSWSLACKYGLVIGLGLQGYGGGVPWAPRLQDRWPFYFGCGPSFLDKETVSDLCFYCWSVCTLRDEVR